MIAFFEDASLSQHNDAVRRTDGREAVRDQDRGGIGQDKLQGLLNLRFGERIHTGGCFVQYENCRALNEYPH